MEHYGGWADEHYGAVADTFARNFADFPELGAAVTVFVDGRKVAELWGGVADRRTGRLWNQDTPVPVFSCAKGIVSLCAHLLAQEGRLDLDAPVSRYWPEFAQHGKESLTCRTVLGHRAGLPALDRTPAFEEIAAWTPVIPSRSRSRCGSRTRRTSTTAMSSASSSVRSSGASPGSPRARTSAAPWAIRWGYGPGSACPQRRRTAAPGSSRPRGGRACRGPNTCSPAS